MSQIGEENEQAVAVQQEQQKIKHEGSVSSHSRKSSSVSEDKQIEKPQDEVEQTTQQHQTEATNGNDQAVKTESQSFTPLQPAVDLAHLGNTYQIGPLEPEVKEQLPSDFYESQYGKEENQAREVVEQYKAPESEIIHVLVEQPKADQAQQAHQEQPHEQHKQVVEPVENVQQHSPPVVEEPQQHQVVVEVPPPENTHPYEEQHLAQPEEQEPLHAAHIEVPHTELMPVPLASDQIEQKRMSEYEEQKVVPEDQKISLPLNEQQDRTNESQPIPIPPTPQPIEVNLEQPRDSNKTKDTQLPTKTVEVEDQVKLLRDQIQEPIKKSYVNMKDPKRKPSKEGSHSEGQACKCSTM